ncbi:MAG: hypothetical protein H6Q33_2793 [Deltaproteobacteria bacterium]|nr:hypothetical protein [Deltaproteobacteria bacterium]
MIRRIDHVAISTADAERMLQFYRDVLGFEVVSDTSWPRGTQVLDDLVGLKDSAARSIMLRKGDTRFELFQYESPPPRPVDPRRPVCDHGITHFCLEVADIYGEYERLRAAGMTFHCAPKDFGVVRSTYGRDPDGNVIELYEEVAAAGSPASS